MKKFKILILAANPTDGVRLALDKEIKFIMNRISTSHYSDKIELDFCLAAERNELLEVIETSAATIVHFMGHSNSEGLFLANEDNFEEHISTKILENLFSTVGEKTKLVVLNSCSSYEVAVSLAKICGGAIGMLKAISDDAARIFSTAFYRALANGNTVGKSFDQAKIALQIRDVSESNLPVLESLDKSVLDLTIGTTTVAETIKFSSNEIELLVETAMVCDLHNHRGALVEALPFRVRNNLPVHSIPEAQIRSDMTTLNIMGRVRGEENPVLVKWLEKAEAIAGFRLESDLFTEFRNRLLEYE